MTSRVVPIGRDGLAWDDLCAVAFGERVQLELTDEAAERVDASRARIQRILETGESVYGVNTGFGKLARVRVGPEQLTQLQHNLLLSHATGLGEPLSPVHVRLALALRITNLSRGNSGVRRELLDRLIALFNADALAVVPSQGSVGACGDLAPLAHLALPVIGEGEVVMGGELMSGAAALERLGLQPLALEAKEGLALINGTQISLAFLLAVLARASKLVRLADLAGCMSLEALKGTDSAFDARVVALRPHPGMASSADNLRRLMVGSQIRDSHRDCDRVQDPYSLRCMPQVHGASRDALRHAVEVARREASAVTDNPLVMDDGDVISAGNFHGQPVALAADYTAIALSELANISACRIGQLVNPDLSGLPPFLVEGGGLNSGFMIAHVAAVSLVSENKTLAHPASVDSIPTSAAQEDHVSMSTFAARKCAMVATNVEGVLAIELLAAAQGIDFHAPIAPGPAVQAAHAAIRAEVPFFDRDRYLKPAVDAVLAMIRDGRLLAAAEAHVALHGLSAEVPTD